MLLARVAASAASVQKSGKRGGKQTASAVTNQLKMIDFGEANETDQADRIEVGTPGYMAPEVMTDGDCTSASDVYSAGVSLVEIWNGGLWAGAETRGEGSDGMRRELLDALQVVECAEPDVGRWLRRMVSMQPADRPSTTELIKAFKQLRKWQLYSIIYNVCVAASHPCLSVRCRQNVERTVLVFWAFALQIIWPSTKA